MLTLKQTTNHTNISKRFYQVREELVLEKMRHFETLWKQLVLNKSIHLLVTESFYKNKMKNRLHQIIHKQQIFKI